MVPMKPRYDAPPVAGIALAGQTAVLVLERYLEQARLTDPLASEYRDLLASAVGEAVRHAGLTLHIALAGKAAWRALVRLQPALDESVFCRRMEALLDFLKLAGLETADPTYSSFRAAVRSARRGGHWAVAAGEELYREAAARLDGGEAERQTLDAMIRELGRGGQPHLARLLNLRLPWGESIFLGLVECFLDYRVRAHQERGADLSPRAQAPDWWLCLADAASLLDENAAAVEAWLDQAQDDPGEGGREREDNAIERLVELGLSRHLQGAYQQAAAHFTEALTLDPARAPVLRAARRHPPDARARTSGRWPTTTSPCGWTPPTPPRSSAGRPPTTSAARTSAPSPTAPRPSSSSRTTPRHTSPAPPPSAHAGATTRRSPTWTRPSRWPPKTRRPLTSAASFTRAGAIRRAVDDFTCASWH